MRGVQANQFQTPMKDIVLSQASFGLKYTPENFQ